MARPDTRVCVESRGRRVRVGAAAHPGLNQYRCGSATACVRAPAARCDASGAVDFGWSGRSACRERQRDTNRIVKCTIDAVTSATNGSRRATGQNRLQPVSRNTSSSCVWREQPERPGRAEHDDESERAPRRTTRAGGAGTAPRRPGRGPCAARACVARSMSPPVSARRSPSSRSRWPRARRAPRPAAPARNCSGTFSVRPQPLHRNAAASEATSIGCFVPQSGHCRTGAISSDQSRVPGRRCSRARACRARRRRARCRSQRRPPRPRRRGPAAMPATTSAAAAFSTAMSRCRALLAGEHRADAACAFVAASPPRERRAVGAGDAEVERVERVDARSSPSTSSCTVLVVVVVSSSSPSSPWNTIACSVPSAAQRAEHRRRPSSASETPTAWRRTRAGFASGPRKLNVVGHAELPAGRTEEPHRRVVAGREAEADAGLLDAARHALGPELDRDAERLEHVGRAALRRRGAVAVLHDPRARARRDQRRHRRDVDRARRGRRRCRTCRSRRRRTSTCAA